MTDQPTPARDVIADWLDDSYGSREDFLGYADAIIDALAAAGYRIAEVGSATVAISLNDAEACVGLAWDEWQMYGGDQRAGNRWDEAERIAVKSLLDRLESAIAAAAEPAE